MMLDARDCYENNGGIRLCRLKMPFALRKNKKRQMREGSLQVRADNDKKKGENRQTEQSNLQRGAVSVTNYKAYRY